MIKKKHVTTKDNKRAKVWHFSWAKPRRFLEKYQMQPTKADTKKTQ